LRCLGKGVEAKSHYGNNKETQKSMKIVSRILLIPIDRHENKTDRLRNISMCINTHLYVSSRSHTHVRATWGRESDTERLLAHSKIVFEVKCKYKDLSR